MENMNHAVPNATEYHVTEAEEDQYDYEYWPWSIIDGSLMLVILCGNTLTILAVTLSRRLSCLISNQFVLNLAISDFLVGLTLPYHLTFYINEELGAQKWSCVLRFILITLACLASIYNLIAIAVDRYIAIVHPLHYSRYMTKVVTRFLLGVTWTIAIAISLIPVFWNIWTPSVRCEMNLVFPKAYTTSILAPMFSMVWVVMLILYWRIWREASCHAKRMRTNTCGPSVSNDWKSIQVVLMVMGSFSICWMPYVVVACAQTLSVFQPHNPTVYRVTFSLAMSNSGINPIIYAWKNAGFRKAFTRLLRCRRPDGGDYTHSFRAASPAHSDRKMQMDEVRSGANNNRPKCRITENLAYAASDAASDAATDATTDATRDAPNCRIIENAGYEEGPPQTNGAFQREPDDAAAPPAPPPV